MKRNIIMALMLSVVLLSSCSSDSPLSKELSETLSSMHDAEKDYRNSQKKLHDKEESEQLIFDEAMKLTQIEDAEVVIKVEEIEASLEERKLLIEKEQASIEEAAKHIPEIERIMKENATNIDDELQGFLKIIQSRYELHKQFIEDYKTLIELQRGLYSKLVDIEIEYKNLQDQVTKVNGQNKIIQATIEEFNKATIEMNERKDEVFESLKDEKQ